MIDSTAFGTITIDGRTYTSDLIIFPDGRIRDGWWRRNGHVLAVDDILDLVDAGPAVIVAGTGTSGRMRPDDYVEPFLAARGVALVAVPNARAVKVYNEKLSKIENVGACFHLTC